MSIIDQTNLITLLDENKFGGATTSRDGYKFLEWNGDELSAAFSSFKEEREL